MKYSTASIVIPVFNEEKFIGKILDQVVNADTLDLKKEIIVIDDGSKDNSKSRIQNSELKLKNNKDIKIITIFKKRNEGKGAALKLGFLKSTGDVVIVQDSDLEYNPHDYPLLLEPFLKNNADVVYGSRFISNRPHRILYFWHYVGNIILTTFSNLFTNLNLTDMETGFKVFRGDLVRSIASDLKSKQFGFEPEITAKIAKIKRVRVFEVGISYWGRTYEEGKKIDWFDGVKTIFEIIRYNVFA